MAGIRRRDLPPSSSGWCAAKSGPRRSTRSCPGTPGRTQGTPREPSGAHPGSGPRRSRGLARRTARHRPPELDRLLHRRLRDGPRGRPRAGAHRRLAPRDLRVKPPDDPDGPRCSLGCPRPRQRRPAGATARRRPALAPNPPPRGGRHRHRPALGSRLHVCCQALARPLAAHLRDGPPRSRSCCRSSPSRPRRRSRGSPLGVPKPAPTWPGPTTTSPRPCAPSATTGRPTAPDPFDPRQRLAAARVGCRHRLPTIYRNGANFRFGTLGWLCFRNQVLEQFPARCSHVDV